MRISSKQIADILFRLAQRDDAEQAITHFLTMLETEKLAYLLRKVPHHLKKREEQYRMLHEASVQSRFPLSAEEIATLRSRMGIAQDAVLHESAGEEKLLGGFVAQGNGKVYDSSLASRIKSLETLLAS